MENHPASFLPRRLLIPVVILLSFIGGNASAQVPDSLWSKTYHGFNFRDVREIAGEQFIIAANISSGFGILKTNALGDSLWFKNYNPYLSRDL